MLSMGTAKTESKSGNDLYELTRRRRPARRYTDADLHTANIHYEKD